MRACRNKTYNLSSSWRATFGSSPLASGPLELPESNITMDSSAHCASNVSIYCEAYKRHSARDEVVQGATHARLYSPTAKILSAMIPTVGNEHRQYPDVRRESPNLSSNALQNWLPLVEHSRSVWAGTNEPFHQYQWQT